MEFRRATLDEQPDPWLVERHEREIFPLLHRRAWFAEANDFLLYDFITDGRRASTRTCSPTRTAPAPSARSSCTTTGSARRAAGSASRRRTRARAPTAASGWSGAPWPRGSGCPNDPGVFVAFRDARTGLESLRSARELWERGLHVSLDAYGGHVFWEFREIHDGWPGQWARLAERLGERARAVARGRAAGAAARAGPRAVAGDLRERAGLGRPRRHGTTGRRSTSWSAGSRRSSRPWRRRPAPTAIRWSSRPPSGDGSRAVLAAPDLPAVAARRAALLAWLALSRTGSWHPARTWPRPAGPGTTSCGCRAPWPRACAGPASTRARRGPSPTRSACCSTLPRPSEIRGPARTADARLLDRWLASDIVRTAIGLNTWEGVEWLDRDRFETQLEWARRLDAIEAAPSRRAAPAGPDAVARLMAAAKAAGYRLDRLTAALGRVAGPSDRVPLRQKASKPEARRPGAVDEASPAMTLLAGGFLGVVHWRRRAPAPDCQTEPPRGAAMRR